MSKDAYIGIDNKARDVNGLYVGVNGVARKVKKAYIGVEGVAQQWWPAAESGVTWLLSESIITTDGKDANDRVWRLSNIDDEFLLAQTYAKKLYRSYDGMVWEYVADIPANGDIMRVNGVYYLQNTSLPYYSDDLRTWTACAFPSGHPINTIRCFQYSGGKFLCTTFSATVGKGTYLYYSNDGKTWSAKELSYSSGLDDPTTWGSFDIVYFSEVGIWLGTASRTDALYYSTDGISWSKVLSNIGGIIRYGDGVFIANGKNNNASPRYRELFKSVDGRNWTCVHHEDLSDEASDYAAINVVALNGDWYASSAEGDLCYRSTDKGDTWEQVDDLAGITALYGKYAFGKYWLGGLITEAAAVSSDGENWRTGADSKILSSEYADGLALYNTTAYTRDGINWHDTNIGKMEQECEATSVHDFVSPSPIKFKNVWVSYYYKSSGNILNTAYYESRLLYLPCKSG